MNLCQSLSFLLGHAERGSLGRYDARTSVATLSSAVVKRLGAHGVWRNTLNGTLFEYFKKPKDVR